MTVIRSIDYVISILTEPVDFQMKFVKQNYALFAMKICTFTRQMEFYGYCSVKVL